MSSSAAPISASLVILVPVKAGSIINVIVSTTCPPGGIVAIGVTKVAVLPDTTQLGSARISPAGM